MAKQVLQSVTHIHCTQFVSISIRNVPSLHMWPVLDAVSLGTHAPTNLYIPGSSMSNYENMVTYWPLADFEY